MIIFLSEYIQYHADKEENEIFVRIVRTEINESFMNLNWIVVERIYPSSDHFIFNEIFAVTYQKK